jgi:hypothetical protein
MAAQVRNRRLMPPDTLRPNTKTSSLFTGLRVFVTRQIDRLVGAEFEKRRKPACDS